PNGVYNVGDTIHVEVLFSKPVTVTATPTVALDTVPARTAVYAGGSGTAMLTFDYAIQAGDNVLTLDYASNTALLLNGGTIGDARAATPAAASPVGLAPPQQGVPARPGRPDDLVGVCAERRRRLQGRRHDPCPRDVHGGRPGPRHAAARPEPLPRRDCLLRLR